MDADERGCGVDDTVWPRADRVYTQFRPETPGHCTQSTLFACWAARRNFADRVYGAHLYLLAACAVPARSSMPFREPDQALSSFTSESGTEQRRRSGVRRIAREQDAVAAGTCGPAACTARCSRWLAGGACKWTKKRRSAEGQCRAAPHLHGRPGSRVVLHPCMALATLEAKLDEPR
jgi:hypothetical protein